MKQNIQEEIKILTDKIGSALKPERIILFGSVARGTHKENSDIDLLIIKKSAEKRPFRIKKVFESIRGIKRNYPLDPIVYTPEELKDRVSLGDFFVKRILNEGKTIYGQ